MEYDDILSNILSDINITNDEILLLILELIKMYESRTFHMITLEVDE